MPAARENLILRCPAGASKDEVGAPVGSQLTTAFGSRSYRLDHN